MKIHDPDSFYHLIEQKHLGRIRHTWPCIDKKFYISSLLNATNNLYMFCHLKLIELFWFKLKQTVPKNDIFEYIILNHTPSILKLLLLGQQLQFIFKLEFLS
jgi:hypothetical protein